MVSKVFEHFRDPRGRFSLLKCFSFFCSRIYDQKTAELCIENYENFTISKQNYSLNNTFGTKQHFKIIFTVPMKSPQLRKASVEVRKLSFVFSHDSHRVWE